MKALGKILPIGTLDRKIVIERYTATRDAYGGEVVTWAILATVWAGVEYGQKISDEKQDTAKQIATKNIVFNIRYSTAYTEKDRILFESEYYDILNITHLGRKRFTVIEAERRV